MSPQALHSRRVGEPHRGVESSLGKAALVERFDAPRRSFRAEGRGSSSMFHCSRYAAIVFTASSQRLRRADRRSSTELSQPERVLINGTFRELACTALQRLAPHGDPGHVGVRDANRSWIRPAMRFLPACRSDPATCAHRSTRSRITAARSSVSSSDRAATSLGKVSSTSRPCASASRTAASSGP